MLRVCFAVESLTFSPICNGLFYVPNTSPVHVIESVTSCPDGGDYCGFDVQVWDAITERVGLQENVDWQRVCIGNNAFFEMLEDLTEFQGIHIARNESDYNVHPSASTPTRPARFCDVYAGGLAADSERSNVYGLQFTRPIYSSPVAALRYVPDSKPGPWDFLRPLAPRVWAAVGVTSLLIPVGVVAMELAFTEWNTYRYERWRWRGRLSALHALGEGVWQSAGHLLQTHHFPVKSVAGRIMVAAYAFAVLVFVNTYVANLSAFLTVDRLQDSRTSIRELYGTRVGTFGPFREVIERMFGLTTVLLKVSTGWDTAIVRDLKLGRINAAIFYEHALKHVAMLDKDCSLRLLEQRVQLLETSFAFRRRFQNDTLIDEINGALLTMQDSGMLDALRTQHGPQYTESACDPELAQVMGAVPVSLLPLSGLWIIYGAMLLLSFCVVCVRILQTRRHPHDASARGVRSRSRHLVGQVRGMGGGGMHRSKHNQKDASSLSDCRLLVQEARLKVEAMFEE